MLLALNGFKGSGKDTFAKFLIDNYGFERLSFADKLKESAAALFEVKPESWDELKNDESARIILKWGKYRVSKDVSARVFLQRYGTESHRTIFYDDFWVDALLPGTKEEYEEWSEGRDLVITDARFDNELKRVRDLGGTIVRIERPELESNDSHVSELAPNDEYIDHVIVNSGTLSELESMAHLFAADLILKEAERLEVLSQ